MKSIGLTRNMLRQATAAIAVGALGIWLCSITIKLAIANYLGHSGMAFTTVAVPSNESAESWWRLVRDGGRSLLWTVTGKTGARIGRQLQTRLFQITAESSNH